MYQGHKIYKADELLKIYGGNTVELWQIFKDGKDGEVYEVVDCSVESYIGMKIKVKADKQHKALVKADTPSWDDDADNLVTLYGCLGTAKYKKYEQYKEITLEETIKRIKGFRTVYVIDCGEYKEISKYTDFGFLDIGDFADLLNKKFFVKEDI
jgi:hypothetical protein